MIRFVLVLALVLSSACAPDTAERCCQTMFPNRPQVPDILAGYAGRRVYDEQGLIGALSDASVRSILLVGDANGGLVLSQNINVWRAGVSIEGVGQVRVYVTHSDAAFTVTAHGVSIRGLRVFGASDDDYMAGPVVNLDTIVNADTSEGIENSVNRLLVEDCYVKASQLFDGNAKGLWQSTIRNNYVDFQSSTLATWKIDIESGGQNAVQGNKFRDDSEAGTLNAIRVASSATSILGNNLGTGAVQVEAGRVAVTGNTGMKVATGAASSARCAYTGNVGAGATSSIDTSASGGTNAIVGNADVGTVTAHASDQAVGNT